MWSGTFRSSKYRLYLFDLCMVNVGSGVLMLADGENQREEKGNHKRRTERQKQEFLSIANCSQSGNAVIKPCRQAIYHQRTLPLAIKSGLPFAMMTRNAVLVPRFAIIVDTANQGLRNHLGSNEGPACAATPIR